MEEQSTTTEEMARSVAVAAQSADLLRREVGDLSAGVRETTRETVEVQTAGTELVHLADEIERMISGFRV